MQPGPRLVLYVNDELNHPLDARQLEGRWVLNPDGAQPVEGPLAPSGDGAFLTSALPSALPDPVHLKVGVRKGGAWVDMEFVLPAP